MWSRYFSHQEIRDVIEGLLEVEVKLIKNQTENNLTHKCIYMLYLLDQVFFFFFFLYLF